MDKGELNPLSVTTLKAGEVPYNHCATSCRPNPPFWQALFIELLAFLKIVDISQPSPQLEDHCFRFQPSQDLSEISRTFISVSTSVTEYDIDIKTLRCTDSNTVPSAVTKLQECAYEVLQKKQAFRDRLLESGVIKNIDGFLDVDLFTCPLCHQPLISCMDCDSVVACIKEECPAFLVTPCKFCPKHQRMACHACLDASDSIPSLFLCEMCQFWHCRSDAEWCTGLITQPAPGTEEFEKLSRDRHWDSKSIVRSHSPRPGPCVFYHLDPPGWKRCILAKGNERHHCPSHSPFLTALDLRASYCPECVEKRPGCHCECDCRWICNSCIAFGNKALDYPWFVTCPRCGVNYCTELESECKNHMDICRLCRGVTVCKSCQEEEEIPGDVHFVLGRPKEIVLSKLCDHCAHWTCTDCRAPQHNATCSDCDYWFCYHCTIINQGYQAMKQCPGCHGDVTLELALNLPWRARRPW